MLLSLKTKEPNGAKQLVKIWHIFGQVMLGIHLWFGSGILTTRSHPHLKSLWSRLIISAEHWPSHMPEPSFWCLKSAHGNIPQIYHCSHDLMLPQRTHHLPPKQLTQSPHTAALSTSPGTASNHEGNNEHCMVPPSGLILQDFSLT